MTALVSFFRLAAALPPPFQNPVTRYKHWFHGTYSDFANDTELADPDIPHEERRPGGTIQHSPPVASEYGDNMLRHWNTDLGSHFAADHDIAAKFAKPHGVGTNSRVAHVALHMGNPKHYDSEFDMTRDAIKWAHKQGYHMFSGATRSNPLKAHQDFAQGTTPSELETEQDAPERLYHLDAHDGGKLSKHLEIDTDPDSPHAGGVELDDYLNEHPDREEITDGWKEHLRKQGHDGLTYGNEYEGHHAGSMNTTCAIPFDDEQVNMHRWEWLDPQQHQRRTNETKPPEPDEHQWAMVNPSSYFPGKGNHWTGPAGEHLGPMHSLLMAHFAAASKVYWRAHPDERPFSVEDAKSQEWGYQGSDYPHEVGYSAFEDPKDLFGYFHPSERVPYNGSHVVSFSGHEVGRGPDDEPLVVPDMKHVQRHDWDDVAGKIVPQHEIDRIEAANGWSDWHDSDDARLLKEGAVWEHPKPTYQPVPEGASDDEILANGEQQRGIQSHWLSETRRAISRGDLTPQQAWNNGYKGHGHDEHDNGAYHRDTDRHNLSWKSLPQTLWHVTTNKPAVLAGGLKSRQELSQRGGLGLGGGEDDTISLTDDEKVAHNIHRALHEYHSVLTGKTTPQDLMDQAHQGGFEKHIVYSHGGPHPESGEWQHGDPYPAGLQDLLDGVASHHTSATPEEATEKWGPEARPHPKGSTIQTKDGPIHIGWQHPMSVEEKMHAASDLYKHFSRWREFTGGHEDPGFIMNDPKGLAEADPSKFGIVKVHPKPGAHGYQVSALGEWRTADGSALHVADEPTQKTGATQEPYLHYSNVLFEPGDSVLPISQIPGKRSPYDGANLHYSPDHVYLFRASEVPKDFRAQGGALYEVHPHGEVERDPEPYRRLGPTPGSYRTTGPVTVTRMISNNWRDPREDIPSELRGSAWKPGKQPRPYRPKTASASGYLDNPYHDHQEWFHGTKTSFEGAPDPSHKRDTEEAERAAQGHLASSQFNQLLGTHFSSLHQVAHHFAGEYSADDSRVFHARLKMPNPVHFPDEASILHHVWRWASSQHPDALYDEKHNDNMAFQYGKGATMQGIDQRMEAYRKAKATGSLTPAMDHRAHSSIASSIETHLQWHPQAHGIARAYVQHLKDAGYTGVTYGNVVEGPKHHICAIATDPDQIEITHVDRMHSPALDDQKEREAKYQHVDTVSHDHIRSIHDEPENMLHEVERYHNGGMRRSDPGFYTNQSPWGNTGKGEYKYSSKPKVPVYRGLYLSDDPETYEGHVRRQFDHREPVGSHWSTDPEVAKAFALDFLHGAGGAGMVLHGEVDPEHIMDRQDIHRDQGVMSPHHFEQEAYIRPGSPIDIHRTTVHWHHPEEYDEETSDSRDDWYDEAPEHHDPPLRVHAMGVAGPDYGDLSFRVHSSPQPGQPHRMVLAAHHPEYGYIGHLHFTPWTGQSTSEDLNDDVTHLQVHLLQTDSEHQRRGVASALMRHMESWGIPIDHGERTVDGEEWAKSQYGQYGNPSTDPDDDMNVRGRWTKDGRPWDPATEQTMDRFGSVLTDWKPTQRLFAPTKGTVDPRLFGPDRKMHADIRDEVLEKVGAFFLDHGFGDMRDGWARVYLAGSQASEWWGNNDFDILVGIEYQRFRSAHPSMQDLSDAEIGRKINRAFQADFNDEQWHPGFDPEHEWHLTGYVFLPPKMYQESKLSHILGACLPRSNSLPSKPSDSLPSIEMRDTPRRTLPKTSGSTSSPSHGISISPGFPVIPAEGVVPTTSEKQSRAGSAEGPWGFVQDVAGSAREKRIGSTTSPARWGSRSSSMTPPSSSREASAPSVESPASGSRWTTTTAAVQAARHVASASEVFFAPVATEPSGFLAKAISNEPSPMSSGYDSWDIRKIKPYAAYNITDDAWAVDPIHEPTGHQFAPTEWYYFEGVAEQVRRALSMKEPTRSQRCEQIWSFVHSDRSRAFGPHGTGAFDRGNSTEKYLDQAPSDVPGKSLMEMLREVKYGNA